MKKEKTYFNFSWIIFIGMAAIGIVLAKTLFSAFNLSVGTIPFKNIYLYDFLIMLFGFISCTLIYLLGKIIFSLIAGFKILCVNYFLIGAKKINGKITFFFGNKEDYACRVIIAPKKEKPNYLLAHLGGTIFTLIVIAITYALIFGLNADSGIKYFFILSSLFYVFSIVIFLLPVRMDHLNDGFILRLVKDKEVKETYFSNLNNFAYLYTGEGELTLHDVKGKEDPISLEAEIYNYYYYLDHSMDKEALDKIIYLTLHRKALVEESQVSSVFIGRIYYLCLKGDNKELNEYYWKLDNTTRSLVQGKVNYEGIKTALYIAAYLDNSKSVYENVLSLRDKVKKNYRFISRLNKEDELIEEMKVRIESNKTSWEEVKEEKK